MNNRPIGVFDSGLGGLSSVKVLEEILPDEQIIFFGDGYNMPYGDKSVRRLNRIAQNNVDFLKSFDVKMILVACGTISANCLSKLKKNNDLEIIGVIDQTALKAVETTRNRKVGIIATVATINSQCFQKRINQLDSEIEVQAVGCQKLAPMVESGHFQADDEMVREILPDYLSQFDGIDTIILGCTHYALLKEAVQQYFNNEINIVCAGSLAGQSVKQYLQENDLLADKKEKENEFYCSGDCEVFAEKGQMFLNHPLEVKSHIIK